MGCCLPFPKLYSQHMEQDMDIAGAQLKSAVGWKCEEIPHTADSGSRRNGSKIFSKGGESVRRAEQETTEDVVSMTCWGKAEGPVSVHSFFLPYLNSMYNGPRTAGAKMRYRPPPAHKELAVQSGETNR